MTDPNPKITHPAASISAHVCEHGMTTITLFDAKGEVIIAAHMPPGTAMALIEDTESGLEAYAANPKTPGDDEPCDEVVGHA